MSATDPQASDIVDSRLLDVLRTEGCPICAVRARSEKATMDAIINERVLDIGFRADLERKQGFCRRHVAELVPTDRRETGGILGSSMLLSAVIGRRLERARGGPGSVTHRIALRLRPAPARPPCIACSQGEIAVATALARLASRSSDPAWAAVLADSPFCLDDFLLLWQRAGSRREFEPVARRQVERFEDLRRRLDGYAHHSSHDRIQLMTDEERTAADEATRLLGGDLH
ncbi:MAG: DUF6062 family protein [Chloroflexota bacterium]